MTPPSTLTADARRQIAREVMAETQALSRAITDGDVTRVKDCLEQGALPELCHFGKGKKSTTNALGAAVIHRNLDLLELLMDAGADMTGPKNQPNPLDTAVTQDFPEAVQLFCNRFGLVPKTSHFIEAIEHPSSTRMFETLDVLSPLDRNADLAGHGTGYVIPPVFMARTVEMYRLLVDSGADPTVVTQRRPGANTLDFLEWQLSRDWGCQDSHTPLVKAAIADGVQVRIEHLDMALEASFHATPIPVDFLDLLGAQVPNWDWMTSPERLGYGYGRAFQTDHPDVFLELFRRKEDRNLRVQLEGTLNSGGPAKPRSHL
jgi:hypothetical protein